MQCDYFGICGSCTLHSMSYEAQLEYKHNEIKAQFASLYTHEFDLIRSEEQGFRARAEFKIWHEGDALFYAMNTMTKEGVVLIDRCPMVVSAIGTIMPKLIVAITDLEMGHKLFNADFLAASDGSMVISLIYHKALDSAWHEKAQKLSQMLGVSIIGRSRKQKIVVGRDAVIETLVFDGTPYQFVQIENSFTQPNPRVNEQMVSWVLSSIEKCEDDLLELYCGAGNFTLPLSKKFRKVLATEISKASIKAARENCERNQIDSITFLRMSSEEFVEAHEKVRTFNRLEGVDLDAFKLNTVFVDPPRSGLDETTRTLVKKFDKIIYISCNPQTLHRDLDELTADFTIEKMALFDQFAYTHHIEMGAILRKKEAQ